MQTIDLIAIIGASGHGLVVADVVRCAGRLRVVGFLDSGKPVGVGPAGLPILGPGEAVESGLSWAFGFHSGFENEDRKIAQRFVNRSND